MVDQYVSLGADAGIRFDLFLLVDLSRASCITAAGSQSVHYRLVELWPRANLTSADSNGTRRGEK